MSSKDKSAEQLYIDAFERLVAQGKVVSQNKVAREAGRDPSAFKLSRYPVAVMKVQAYVQQQNEKKETKKRLTDNRTRTKKERATDYRNQIDKLSSIVAAQNMTIQTLMDEINSLKQGVIKRNIFPKQT